MRERKKKSYIIFFVNKIKKGWIFREKERGFDGVVDELIDWDMEKEMNFGWIVVNMLVNFNVFYF